MSAAFVFAHRSQHYNTNLVLFIEHMVPQLNRCKNCTHLAYHRQALLFSILINAKVGIIIEKAQNYLVFYSLNRTFARKTRFWVYGQQERSVAEECRTTVEND